MLFKRFPVALKFRSRRAETCSEQTIDFDGEVNLFHYELQHIIGKGTYGCVRIVKHRKTGNLFALKFVDKHQCLKSGISANVVQERRLLENIRHPFIVNMHQAFQDTINCYFILDLMLGGHLGFHRLRMGSLSENSVRFFVAEISSALAFLHQNGICHRDVKPENILLDAQGHAHLTDFNVAFHYSTAELNTEVAGTMVYMAPEVLQRHGYSWQIDYWSLGVTAFECLFHGQRPFADKCRSVEILRKSIMTDTLVFPSEPKISQDGIAAITMLLEKDPSKRLGCQYLSRTQGQMQLRSHRWFRKIDWKKLDSKKLLPPFVPDNRVSNFEKPSVDEVSNKRRRMTLSLDKRSPDLAYLEQSFSVYDSTKTKAINQTYQSNTNDLFIAPRPRPKSASISQLANLQHALVL